MTTARTSLPPPTDSLVIGGGVMGLFVARALRRSGRRVALLEAHASDRGFLGGASRAGGGILSPLTPWNESELVQALAIDSQARYPAIARHLASRTGIDIEYRRTGGVFVGEASARAMARWCDANGIAAHDLANEALRARMPGLATTRALQVPGLAQVRNPRLLDALAADIAASGVDHRRATRALALVSRQGRVAGALTDAGPVRAGEVVVTAGAWSGQLLASAGFAPRVRPVRGQMLWFAPFEGAPTQVVLGESAYIIPRADGVCLAGSTVEEVGFDISTTAAAAERIHAAAAALVPALAAETPAGQWSGLRPAIDGPDPFVGPVPGLRGLYACAGHFRNGLTLAPASAALLRRRMDELV